MRQLFMAALVMALGVSAHAGELDKEQTFTTEQVELAKNLPATLVVRVKTATQEVEVLHSSKVIEPTEASKELVSTSSFEKIDVKGGMTGVSELDKDSSSSSWYFCFPNYNYYYPSYNYYGYNYSYSNYYSYYYAGYQYSYYSWPYYNNYGYGGGYGGGYGYNNGWY